MTPSYSNTDPAASADAAAPKQRTSLGDVRHEKNEACAWPPGLTRTTDREAMLRELNRLTDSPVVGYVWAFRKIHPGVLLTLSFALSQIVNEIAIYELFEAYGTRSTVRTLFEIISPLTLWLLVDTVIQIALTLLGLGHRILAQTAAGELLIFHRRLFNSRPAQLERQIHGSLSIAPQSLGFAIDRLDTSIGRFYIWARWRDMRLLLTLRPQAPGAACPAALGSRTDDGKSPETNT